jgi:hypothetical protein
LDKFPFLRDSILVPLRKCPVQYLLYSRSEGATIGVYLRGSKGVAKEVWSDLLAYLCSVSDSFDEVLYLIRLFDRNKKRPVAACACCGLLVLMEAIMAESKRIVYPSVRAGWKI